MRLRATVVMTAVLTLAACATDIPRSRYPEVRAQLENAVQEQDGVRMIMLQIRDSHGGRTTYRLNDPAFTDTHVCWEGKGTVDTDGKFWENKWHPTGCYEYRSIAAVGDVNYRPGIEGVKVLNDVGGPVLCVALLPLCLIGKGVPSGG